MSLPYSKELIIRAKELRKNATRQENHLWYDFLRSHPVRFQRQKVIDRFIVDFYCHEVKLVIELDGSQHFSEQGMSYDNERTDILSKFGITVLRFTNLDIERNFRAVCEKINDTVKQKRGSLSEGAVSEAD